MILGAWLVGVSASDLYINGITVKGIIQVLGNLILALFGYMRLYMQIEKQTKAPS